MLEQGAGAFNLTKFEETYNQESESLIAFPN